MYRESQESFARTIEQLEGELAEVRQLLAPRQLRERTMWVVTASSVLAALLSVVGAACVRARAELVEQRWEGAAARLDTKTRDLGLCESVAEQSQRAAQQCRIERGQLASMP